MAFSQVLTCFGLLPAPCPSFFSPWPRGPSSPSAVPAHDDEAEAAWWCCGCAGRGDFQFARCGGPEASILRLLLSQDLYSWAA